MKVFNVRSLIKAKNRLRAPFLLKVQRMNGDQVCVQILEIFRLLPSKRLVARAHCDGQKVLVKAFLGLWGKSYANKDRLGVQLMNEAEVQSPKLLWRATFVDGLGQMLVFEYLCGATTLEHYWGVTRGTHERIVAWARTVVIIAKLHNQGIVQTDIHLRNFMIFENRIYAIDGGYVMRKAKTALSEKASLKNLSWFFAQFLPKFDEFVQSVLPDYEVVRGWSPDPGRLLYLHRVIQQNRESRKCDYLDKVFRDCAQFKCDTSFSRFMVCERRAYSGSVAKLLQNPDSFMAKGELLKDGHSATVVQVNLNGQRLVIKRYNIKSFWHGISRTLRKTRARTAWLNAFHMEFLGIKSLKPIAMLEYRFGPWRGKAYLITEYIEGPNALSFFKQQAGSEGKLEALVKLLKHLSSNQVSHGDLKATNFLMGTDGPVIIDLDAMRQHKSQQSFKKAFNKDLNRFMKNWEDQPELVNKFSGLLKYPP